jgi:putative transposase
MSALIDEQRAVYGVEPICRVLEIAPSTYYEVKRRERDPSPRACRDAWLLGEIRRVHAASGGLYGARKVWWQLAREEIPVARCAVERLMREAGLEGVVRGGKRQRTTTPNEQAERPPDLVERDFTADAPDRLWVCDFTYVATWAGFCYVAFVIDVFSRRLVGWNADRSMQTGLVLDAFAMALWARDHAGMPVAAGELVHHSDAGSQLGFKGSSQRSSQEEPSDGRTEVRSGGAGGDALAGSSVGGSSGASAAVLGGDRPRRGERGRGRRGRCVGRGWRPVVSRGWRDAYCHSGPVVGALPVVC